VRALARLAFISSVQLLAILSFGQASTHDQEDRAVGNEYLATLSAEFPIDQKLGLHVGYRYSHAPVPGDLENSFVISSGVPGGNQTLHADLRVADTTSIFEQLTALHLAQPHEPLKELRSKLKVRVSQMTEAECPAVRDQFDKFKKLVFPAPRFDFISVDIPNHEFQIVSSTGEMTFEWLDEKYPLVTWAQETRQSLEPCVSSGLKINGPKK
jgi:hypothetical protein